MTDKFAAIMSRMDSGFDGEAENAFRQASRILKGRGLRWSDIAPLVPAGSSSNRTRDPFASAFEGIFSDSFNRPRRGTRTPQGKEAAPEAADEPFAKINVQGIDVPAEIYGAIEITDERKLAKGGTMIVFTVESIRTIYGPLVAFDAEVRRNLKAAAGTGVSLHLSIRKAWNPAHHPCAIKTAMFHDEDEAVSVYGS